MIHNVILDFGNVLGTFDKHKACERLAAYSENLSGPQIYDLLVGSELEKSLETGSIDDSTFAKELINAIHAQDLSKEKCLEIWSDIFAPNPGMADLLEEMKERGISFAVLSTTSAPHWPYIRKLDIIQLLERWDVPFILSYEHGAMKPEAKLYIEALSALGCKPQDAAFVDDILENVDAARQLGMVGILYNCTKQPASVLQDSLLPILA